MCWQLQTLPLPFMLVYSVWYLYMCVTGVSVDEERKMVGGKLPASLGQKISSRLSESPSLKE